MVDVKPLVAVAFPIIVAVKYLFFSNNSERKSARSDFAFIAVLLSGSGLAFLTFLVVIAELYTHHLLR